MPSDALFHINWQQMIRPQKIEVTSNPTYGKFVCEPLERGFGITLGNALRRVILSSLYGAAITSVRIDGVMHEFSTIPGVLEDVSEILLNLKEIRFKVEDAKPKVLRIDASGPCEVSAADIVCEDGRCTVLNPKQHIATLSEKGALKMTMTVKVGKGYALAEANKEEEAPLGTIPIDAVFSPIQRGQLRRRQRPGRAADRLRQAHDGGLDRRQPRPGGRRRLRGEDPQGADEHLHQLRRGARTRLPQDDRPGGAARASTRTSCAASTSSSCRSAAPTASRTPTSTRSGSS